MRLVLNLIWLVFGGLVMALGYAIAALVMLILIITIPFGIAAGRMALFCVWPFGRTLVRRGDAGVASTIGNVIWFVLAGLWLAIGYALAALVCFILIITIPFGVAALRIGVFALWPFGRTVVRRADAGAGSAIGNVIWFLLCGLWLAIGHIITGIALCLTIIGIPLGLANFKLIPVSLTPFGRDIVPVEQAAGYESSVRVG